MDWEPVLILCVIFFSIVAIVKIVSENRTRQRLIDKGDLDDRSRRLLVGQAELGTLSNIKWGMVLVGVGLASLLSYWIPDYCSEEGAIGLVFIFSGLGFLVYYPIAQKRLRDIERRNG